MKNNNNTFKKLITIEQNIESNYLKLIKLELNGLVNTNTYTNILSTIKELTSKEMQALMATRKELSYEKIKRIIMHELKNERASRLILKESKKAYYYRLLKIIDSILNSSETLDDWTNYAEALRDDINKIIFEFLEVITDNAYYKDQRTELIYYKYSCIFLNANSEYDLLRGYDSSKPQLESYKYKTSSFIEYQFIDKSELVLESILSLDYLSSSSNKTTSDIIIHIIEILSRLTLCDESLLSLINEKLMSILNSDILKPEVKNIMNEMIEILYSIKNNISLAR